MPVNKNALLRFQILDRCFRGGRRKLDVSELLLYLNGELVRADQKPIRRRQLYDDINTMKAIIDKRIDILPKKDGRRSYYQYSDPDYSIFSLPLSPEEEELLEPALAMLASVAGAPQFESVKDLLPKIRSRLGYKEMGDDILFVDSNPELKGLIYLKTLYFAIRSRNVVKIKYKSFESQQSLITRFHPHILKQFNNRWFVLGRDDEKRDRIQNFALDRIEFIESDTAEYLPPTTDWTTYFEEIIGVTNEETEPVAIIRLEFEEKRFNYVRTKPLHGSQTENGKVVTIKVKHNWELETLILSFGDDVRVLEPDSLKNRIASRWAAALSQSKFNPLSGA